MRRTAEIKNNIGTRVETREKGSDRLPPHSWHAVEQYDSPSNATPAAPPPKWQVVRSASGVAKTLCIQGAA